MPAKLARHLKRNKGLPAKLAGYFTRNKEARAKLRVSGQTSLAAEAALIFFCLLFFYQEKKRGNPPACTCPLSGPFVGRMLLRPTNGAAPLTSFLLFFP